eukprot:Sspe_Gene.44321::Locus_21722_Transcript_1_1_Confidence_1.000_Length_4292::g.44321::m.44321
MAALTRPEQKHRQLKRGSIHPKPPSNARADRHGSTDLAKLCNCALYAMEGVAEATILTVDTLSPRSTFLTETAVEEAKGEEDAQEDVSRKWDAEWQGAQSDDERQRIATEMQAAAVEILTPLVPLDSPEKELPERGLVRDGLMMRNGLVFRSLDTGSMKRIYGSGENAWKVAVNEVNTLQRLRSLGINGLCVPLACVVMVNAFRFFVTTRLPVSHTTLAYGTADGATYLTDTEEVMQVLDPIARHYGLTPHTIQGGNGKRLQFVGPHDMEIHRVDVDGKKKKKKQYNYYVFYVSRMLPPMDLHLSTLFYSLSQPTSGGVRPTSPTRITGRFRNAWMYRLFREEFCRAHSSACVSVDVYTRHADPSDRLAARQATSHYFENGILTGVVSLLNECHARRDNVSSITAQLVIDTLHRCGINLRSLATVLRYMWWDPPGGAAAEGTVKGKDLKAPGSRGRSLGQSGTSQESREMRGGAVYLATFDTWAGGRGEVKCSCAAAPPPTQLGEVLNPKSSSAAGMRASLCMEVSSRLRAIHTDPVSKAALHSMVQVVKVEMLARSAKALLVHSLQSLRYETLFGVKALTASTVKQSPSAMTVAQRLAAALEEAADPSTDHIRDSRRAIAHFLNNLVASSPAAATWRKTHLLAESNMKFGHTPSFEMLSVPPDALLSRFVTLAGVEFRSEWAADLSDATPFSSRDIVGLQVVAKSVGCMRKPKEWRMDAHRAHEPREELTVTASEVLLLARSADTHLSLEDRITALKGLGKLYSFWGREKAAELAAVRRMLARLEKEMQCSKYRSMWNHHGLDGVVRTSLDPKGCFVGIKDGRIPSSALTASTAHKDYSPSQARLDLDDRFSWCPATSDVHQWLQVDLGRQRTITAVLTQGNAKRGEWVRYYKVWRSNDAGAAWPSEWQLVTTNYVHYPVASDTATCKRYSMAHLLKAVGQKNCTKERFQLGRLVGNTNGHDVAVNEFVEPFVAQYVRIQPVSEDLIIPPIALKIELKCRSDDADGPAKHTPDGVRVPTSQVDWSAVVKGSYTREALAEREMKALAVLPPLHTLKDATSLDGTISGDAKRKAFSSKDSLKRLITLVEVYELWGEERKGDITFIRMLAVRKRLKRLHGILSQGAAGEKQEEVLKELDDLQHGVFSLGGEFDEMPELVEELHQLYLLSGCEDKVARIINLYQRTIRLVGKHSPRCPALVNALCRLYDENGLAERKLALYQSLVDPALLLLGSKQGEMAAWYHRLEETDTSTLPGGLSGLAVDEDSALSSKGLFTIYEAHLTWNAELCKYNYIQM